MLSFIKLDWFTLMSCNIWRVGGVVCALVNLSGSVTLVSGHGGLHSGPFHCLWLSHAMLVSIPMGFSYLMIN